MIETARPTHGDVYAPRFDDCERIAWCRKHEVAVRPPNQRKHVTFEISIIGEPRGGVQQVRIAVPEEEYIDVRGATTAGEHAMPVDRVVLPLVGVAVVVARVQPEVRVETGKSFPGERFVASVQDDVDVVIPGYASVVSICPDQGTPDDEVGQVGRLHRLVERPHRPLQQGCVVAGQWGREVRLDRAVDVVDQLHAGDDEQEATRRHQQVLAVQLDPQAAR